MKPSELNKYRTILLATIDYMLLLNQGWLVLDGEDAIASHLEEQKKQVEKMYAQRRLSKMKQKLDLLVKSVTSNADPEYASYIRNHTGYEYDPFLQIRDRVKMILEQKEIKTRSASQDVLNILHYYEKQEPGNNELPELHKLLEDFFSKTEKTRKNEKIIRKTTTQEGDRMVISETIIIRPPGFYEEEEMNSPGGNKRLRIARTGSGDAASTYVAVKFPSGAEDAVYIVKGLHSFITAAWKDDHHITIQTNKSLHTLRKVNTISSQGEQVEIEYVEVKV